MPPKRKPLSAALGQDEILVLPAEQPHDVVAVVDASVKQARRQTTKNQTIQQTVYLPPAVHEQLRKIAFDERVKMHDILIEGLNLAFARRGLPLTTDLA